MWRLALAVAVSLKYTKIGVVAMTAAVTAITVALPLSPASASRPLKQSAAKKVERILATEGSAIKRASAAANFSQVSKDCTHAVSKLRAIEYPRPDRSDAKKLENAIRKLGADAAVAGALGQTLTSSMGKSLESTLANDAVAEIAASNALRSDLGLPPWHKGEL